MEKLLNNIGLFLSSISILILFFGTIFYFLRKQSKNTILFIYVIILFLFEVTSVFTGLLLKVTDTILFSLSFFIHFVFLTHFYFFETHLFKSKFKNKVIGLAVLILLLNFIVPQNYFDVRFIYSSTITFYSLMYLYRFINETREVGKLEVFLNGSILLFFCIDAFLAIATNYLITKSITLVSWFWFFRAVLLQFFYVCLIYYLWKKVKCQ